MLQRPPAGTIPDSPGSYQFKDKDGRVIYVGKAHSLRSRLSNYFVTPSSLPARTAQMVATAESVEWIQVRNDVEAFMLEYNLIKQHRPRFNIRLRLADDRVVRRLDDRRERRLRGLRLLRARDVAGDLGDPDDRVVVVVANRRDRNGDRHAAPSLRTRSVSKCSIRPPCRRVLRM